MSKTSPNTEKEFIDKLAAEASAVDDSKTATKGLQARLDETVLSARQDGHVKYREIAEACGRSVAWVQATLARMGYVGERSKAKNA